MKKTITLFFVFVLLVGCSYPSLEEAINKTGYEDAEVLFQDDINKIVIFSSQDKQDQTLLTLNSFGKGEEKYKYETGTGEFSKHVDVESEYEFLKVNQVSNTSNSIIWGAAFNYEDAEKIAYTLWDVNDNILLESTLVLTESKIVAEILPQDLYEKVEGIGYRVLDNGENVIVEQGY